MSDATVSLVFSVSGQGKVSLASAAVAGNGASVDAKGNVKVLRDRTADLVFSLDQASASRWGITAVALKDHEVGKWDGLGGKPALTAGEEADFSAGGRGFNRVTGQLQFDPSERRASVTISDANRRPSKLDYRLTVATASGSAVGQFDPMVENEGVSIR
ncbi:hypothetical protein [Rehaibacterium terrae]|uniref:hypothetical protein n=1 Tax=Rehaibacterium terrae TaxID=1341696 RepID=UPI00391DA78D